MAKKKHGRHAAAFILLMIAIEPTHGLGILSKMNELIPGNRLDTAIIYRTLKAFEKEGYITSSWEESEAGPQKKVYEITDSGRSYLDEFKLDVEESIENLKGFMKLYDEL